MKRKLVAALCACMLLCGCGDEPTQPVQTAPPETQTVEKTVPLLEQGTAVGESGNLLYIPNEAVEDMTCPEVRVFGNGLLLGAYIRNEYVLRHISLEDGRLLAECRISASPGVRVCIGSGCIGLLDSGTNRFLLLDEALTVQSTQTIPMEGDSGYLSPGMDVLYRFCYDQGVLARDLQTGQERWIVENAVFTGVIGEQTAYVLFSYTDAQTQRTAVRCLDLSTSIMETLPVSDPVSTGLRWGETWLLRKEGTAGAYILADEERASSFSWDASAVTLLSPRKHLLLTDPSGRQLQLYDTLGRFVSTCTLPDAEYGSVGTELVWSGYWDGYFFTDTIDGTCRLMFWDIDEKTQGEDLELIPRQPPQEPEPVLEAALYERAEALSARFGVKILIAEQCAADYSHYSADPLTDPGFVRGALDILERALGMYPEGFFRQLSYDTVDHIQIELVGGLSVKDGVENQPDGISAFTQDQEGYIHIVLNGFLFSEETIYHEFSHVIDRRLAWDAQVRADALYSEERWMALQPEGFNYAMSYTDMPEALMRYADTGYFIGNYSMTYPTEDRATLFADAMTQSPLLEISPGLQAKMDYYARCIRDCFDTEGWPEVTAWEQVLK